MDEEKHTRLVVTGTVVKVNDGRVKVSKQEKTPDRPATAPGD
jgi:hypothetical protein